MVPEKQPELHGCPSPSSQKPCSPSWEQGHPGTPVPAAICPCIPPPPPELALLHSSTPCSRSVPCTPPPPLTRGNFPQRMTQGAGDGSFHSNAGFLIPRTENAKPGLERCSPLPHWRGGSPPSPTPTISTLLGPIQTGKLGGGALGHLDPQRPLNSTLRMTDPPGAEDGLRMHRRSWGEKGRGKVRRQDSRTPPSWEKTVCKDWPLSAHRLLGTPGCAA